ncbi:hypothetical protein DPMN_006589 [Dreissena polymorpha]|uniref:Uncharacterized protein n=1 Tax=Dreissena polymorpha TaxID=45954 RepID=A0A9D4RXI7_DREPO|nr:hypothetical protein DPMN_006589 [Dreissena polymorpha]
MQSSDERITQSDCNSLETRILPSEYGQPRGRCSEPSRPVSSQPFVSIHQFNYAENRNTNRAPMQHMPNLLRRHYPSGDQIFSNDRYCGHLSSHGLNESRISRPHERMRIPPSDGKEDWKVWVTGFDVISDRFGWSDDMRLDQLLQRLEGQAAEFAFTQLSPATLHTYQDLKA